MLEGDVVESSVDEPIFDIDMTSVVSTVDKSIDCTVNMKSVCTQYNPMCVPQPLKQIESSSHNLLKVKIQKSKPKVKTQESNTDISFLPNDDVCFYVQNEPCVDEDYDSAVVKVDLDSSYCPSLSEESSEDEDTTYEHAPRNDDPIMGEKLIIFWSCLLPLFRFCLRCFESASIKKLFTRGSSVMVTMMCTKGHVCTWKSQPEINGTSAGNVLLSASILYSGSTFSKVSEMMKIMNVKFFSEKTFHNIQSSVLFPAVNALYRENVLIRFRSKIEVNLSGDGRCDSPGYNAKYGTLRFF